MNGTAVTNDVNARVDALLARAEALKDAQAPDLAGMAAALRDLDALRAVYAQDRAPFAERVAELRQASAVIEGAVVRWQSVIAEAFAAADRALRREEALRDGCRALLLRAHRAAGMDRWGVGEADVVVRRFNAPELPPPNSAARAALEQFLEHQGRWRAVSILHRPALARALEGGAFSAEEREELTRWCKLGSGYQVSLRAKGAPGT